MATMTLRAASAPDGIAEASRVERCPICGGRRSELLYRLGDPSGTIDGVFELRKCVACELVYVDPRPGEDVLTDLYGETFYFSTGWSYAALASRVIELIQSQRRHRVERHVRPGRLLDIGSGDGRFVHHMARHGWDATGIDISPAALEFARRIENGGRFLQGAVEDVDLPPGCLDLVTMWQVLEHIGEPRPLLGRCRRLLRRGGVFVAAVPNIDGLSSRLTRERWWGLDVPRHLVHYTPGTLTRSLEQAGFRVIRLRHRSFQYDPYALLHSSLDWLFSRRHFLSDLAKRHVTEDVGAVEYAYNLAVLAALAPVLAPISLATTTIASCVGLGGFIEVHARRD